MADADLALDVIGAGTMLSDVARLSDRIPQLRIIIDHLPFEAPEEAFRALRARPNVYAKVSGVVSRVNGVVRTDPSFYRASLDRIAEVFGPDRVIYASNWPVSDKVTTYATVLKVVQEYYKANGSDDSVKFFRQNSAAAYKWISRTAHP